MLRCPPQGACWTGAQPARPTGLLSPGHPPSILHGTLLGHHIPLHLGPLPRGLLRTRVNKCSLDDVRISRIYTPTRGIRGCAVQCVYLWTAVSNVARGVRLCDVPARSRAGARHLCPHVALSMLSAAWRGVCSERAVIATCTSLNDVACFCMSSLATWSKVLLIVLNWVVGLLNFFFFKCWRSFSTDMFYDYF